MPASPSGGRQKWRKRGRVPKNMKRHRQEDEDEDYEEEENNIEPDEDDDLHPNPNPPSGRNPSSDPHPGPSTSRERESEVVGGSGIRISDFPPVVKHTVNRPHASVMAILELEKATLLGERETKGAGQQQSDVSLVLENVSYGQLQALSAVPADTPALTGASADQESASAVVTPPPIMEGSGVVKKFWNNRVHVVPLHADWFSPETIHRLERQVVPLYFSGKSADHTPEKYMDCRNMIVAKYMENPEKRLLVTECQGLAVGVDTEDLYRIFRFLDHWGIVNYCAPPPNQESWNAESYLREDSNGEVHVPSAALKAIDSLIKFDKPKCRLKACEAYSSSSSNADDLSALNNRIREKLSENHCDYCSRPAVCIYYQSLKEADTLLCLDCYNEGRFVVGHSSLDFMRVDSTNDYGDLDGESWTDQETLLLLEAVEIYTDNWNEIAEHVRTKSKAQCFLHFLQFTAEYGLLENIDVKDGHERSHVNSNGNAAGPCDLDSNSNRGFPFTKTGNPVASLVAFLASAVGPRVAAACAHASLAVLTEDDDLHAIENSMQMDGLVCGNRINSNDDLHGDLGGSSHRTEDNIGTEGPWGQNRVEASPLSVEKVKSAAQAGLAAAAVKAKLFADHEEREIQRLSANIINHQLKRLELKLKQFAEVETLLMKECEQVEKTRQRLAAERARVISAGFGQVGAAQQMNSPGVGQQMNSPGGQQMNSTGVAHTMVNNSIGNSRPLVMSASPSQPSVSRYGNIQMNHPGQMNHPHMPFMQPRQSMFSFGPRLPLSAIQPSSGPSTSVMFGAQGSGQSSVSHPMMRPVPGTSSALG